MKWTSKPLKKLFPAHRPDEMGLAHFQSFLEVLGNPHLALPKTYHIAGTNGKGSTTHFLTCLFKAMDLKNHAFLSPHLRHPKERFFISGYPMEQTLFDKVYETISEKARLFGGLSWFELLTAIGFYCFAKERASYLALEVGLGGRLDATNVIPSSKVALITPIAFDHQAVLGNTLEKIAQEKAGIIGPKSPVFSVQQDREVQKVLERKARDLQACLYQEKDDWHYHIKEKTFFYKDVFGVLEIPWRWDLPAYQSQNLALALASIRYTLKKQIKKNHLEKGLALFSMPGRLQRWWHHPWRKNIPKDIPVYLDGTHNPHGAQFLQSFLTKFGACWVFMGVGPQKDARRILNILGSQHRYFFFPVPGQQESRRGFETLIDQAKASEISFQSFDSLEKAIDYGQSAFGPSFSKYPKAILVTGSLYTVGACLDMAEPHESPSFFMGERF